MQTRLLRATLNWRTLATGLGATALTGLLIGIPTAVVPNSYFSRMTPVRPQDYMFLAITAVLTGLLAASYTVPFSGHQAVASKVSAAGVLSVLAIGCPICNKVVLLLLGVSGAMAYWAPLQPALGALSVVLLGLTLWIRVSRFSAPCATCA